MWCQIECETWEEGTHTHHVPLIKGDVVFLTQCGVFCGVFHQKSKSPQVFVVIWSRLVKGWGVLLGHQKHV